MGKVEFMTAWSHSLKGIKVNGGIKIRFIKGIHKGLDRRLTDTDLVCNVLPPFSPSRVQISKQNMHKTFDPINNLTLYNSCRFKVLHTEQLQDGQKLTFRLI